MSLTNEQMYSLITKPQPELIERYDMINKPDPEELMHFGILGMQWGKRRYQNEDGTLTPAGKERYGSGEQRESSEGKDRITGDQVKEMMKKKGVDYNDIYKEMGVSEDEEDNDVYKEAEYAWYKKHKDDDKSDKNAKDSKEVSKETIRDMSYKEWDYAEDFKNTEEYKKADAEFDKAYDDYNNNRNKETSERYFKAERKYLAKNAEYIFSQMLKEYGPVAVSLWMSDGEDGSLDVNKLKDEYIDNYIQIHAT